MKKILILCRQNACRSIMAEAIANHYFGDQLQAFSAGSEPVDAVHPKVIATLQAKGIDTADLKSKSWDAFIDEHFDVVLTVCNSANKACPHFPGDHERLHWPIPDPAKLEGTEEEIDQAFTDTFDLLKSRLAEELIRS